MKTIDKIQICKAPGCGRKFTVRYRNGIKVSNYCPSCTLKRLRGNGTINNKVSPSVGKISNVTSTGKKKTPRQRAMDRADKYFSRYMRIKHSKEMGGAIVCACYTCGQYKVIKNIENGHYHTRENKSVRFDEDNTRPQCTHCNGYKSGRHTQFGENLRREIGEVRFEALRKKALLPGKDSEQHYSEVADYYREKIKELCKELSITDPFKSERNEA
jgi:hypothetical protein